MALWNKVRSGFDKEEETVNFGPRTVAENNGSFYEILTLATIQADGEVDDKPKVYTSVEHSSVCIAIEKTITVFESKTCERVLSSISFGALITCYSITKDSSFLFIALENGIFYCIHLLTGKKVFSKKVTDANNHVVKLYLKEECDENIIITLLAKSGVIYRTSEFNVQLFAKAVIVDNDSAIKELIKNLQYFQLFKGFFDTEVIYSSTGIINQEQSIAMVCSDMLFMWPSEQYNQFNFLSYKYTKVLFLKNCLAMLCLRTDHILNVVCPQTLLGLKAYDQFVLDFTIIETNDCQHQIVVLIPEENSATHVLRVLSYPELEQKYQINVPKTTYLIEILDPDHEILFLEGVNEIGNIVTSIDTIRLKAITESLPEFQLQRLLRKQQFDAAKAFADKFNLSLQPIYCAKAALLASQLAKKNSNSINLDTLISLLDKVEDLQYIVECCSKLLVPQYEEMKKIHLYARARIVKSTERTKNNECLKLLCLINDALHKLETFYMIWGCQREVENNDANTMEEWTRFSRANFMNECKMHLSQGEMEAATLIWTRHFSYIMPTISSKTVQDILETIPEGTPPLLLWPWLSHFIPILCNFLPDTINEIIQWVCRKIKSFEQSHRAEWPQIGIDFANGFIKLLQFKENHQSIYLQQEYAYQDSNLKQFMSLVQVLPDIKKLKMNYRLRIPLDIYIEEPIYVAHVLLDKIHVNVILEFVNTYLKQYMLNNSLQNDHVLSLYIQKTLRNAKSWWSGEEGPWEKRAVAIINLISNLEAKLQQTLDILKKASVPWSSTMIALAEKSCILDHILASEIRTEYNYVPIKLILKEYGYASVGVTDRLIFLIAKVNNSNMITHIQQLCKAHPSLSEEAFSSVITYHTCRGNLKRVIEIFYSIEDNMPLYLSCCLYTVNYVTACLTLKILPKIIVHYIEIIDWMKCRLETISEQYEVHSNRCNSIIATIKEVKSIYLLRQDFHINVKSFEYHTQKNQILRNYIKQISHENTKNNDDLQLVYNNSIKVADLLNLQRLDVVSALLECTKNGNVLKYCTRSQGSNLSLTIKECRNVNKICLLTLQQKNIDLNIATIVLNLNASALCVCSNSKLQFTVKLNGWFNLYRESLNKYGADVDDENEELLKLNWKLYTIYKDLSLSVDQLTLPLLRDATKALRFDAANLHSDKTMDSTDNAIESSNQFSTKRLNDVLDKMKNLKTEHSEYSMLQIIKVLYFDLCGIPNVDPFSITQAKSLFLYFIMSLLRKLISARKFDLHLGLCCLFMLPQLEARNWIFSTCKSLQTNYAQHSKVTVLGYEYYRLTKDQKLVKSFKDMQMLHCWAKRLSKYSISYKEIMMSDANSKRELLQRIMNNDDDNTMSLLQCFCSDFGFDIQNALLFYLQVITNAWDPKLNISTSNGKTELRINEDEVTKLENKCNAIAEQISDKTVLRNFVTALFPKINFYHYEVFLILMDLIDDKNVEYKNYFCFLQNYTRTGQPTEVEQNEWERLNSANTSLPRIAEWRLPFLPKIDIWKLITPELDLKTYEKWLDIAVILKLQPHIIYTLAIKGEVTRVWGKVTYKQFKTDKWMLCARNTNLLTNIKKCIEQMVGPDALYYGTAALYYVLNHTPPGADLVAAAQECYNYAQLAAEKSAVIEPGMLDKIKFKYLAFTSEHILRTHGLGNEKYLSLIGNPQKLVHELYRDESIPLRYQCITDLRPDINSAVRDLCELFSINIVKLRLELLQEWLQPDSRYNKLNDSITCDLSIFPNSEQNTNIYNMDDNLLRACYVLEHGDRELSANFLLNIGLGDNKEDYGSEIRYRALHVLQNIIDTATLENLTKQDLRSIRQYMKCLKHTGKLMSLGLGYTVKTFETCSKYELIKILWKTQSSSPQALCLIAQICIDFEIYEYSIWDKNLSQLVKLRMVDELKGILLKVQNISVIVNSNGYCSGWQVVISEPFRKMDVNPTSEQIDSCIESLRLLHSCPVTHTLFFHDIINNCFQCKQPHLAAALLPFLNDADTKHILKAIKSELNIKKVVLEDLNNLALSGVLLVSYCKKILQDAII